MKTKINVGIIGTPGCGKTSFVRRHVDGQYCADEFTNTPHVVLEIVDTRNGQCQEVDKNYPSLCSGSPNQVDCRMIESEYIPDTQHQIDAFIVLFVCNNVSSYEFAKNRVDEILDMYPTTVPVAICGTMNDTPRQLRGLLRDLSIFCAETGCEPCLLSNKTGDKINDPFTHIIQTIFNNDSLQISTEKESDEARNITNMHDIITELNEIQTLDTTIKNVCPRCSFIVIRSLTRLDFVYCTNPDCNNSYGFHN